MNRRRHLTSLRGGGKDRVIQNLQSGRSPLSTPWTIESGQTNHLVKLTHHRRRGPIKVGGSTAVAWTPMCQAPTRLSELPASRRSQVTGRDSRGPVFQRAGLRSLQGANLDHGGISKKKRTQGRMGIQPGLAKLTGLSFGSMVRIMWHKSTELQSPFGLVSLFLLLQLVSRLSSSLSPYFLFSHLSLFKIFYNSHSFSFLNLFSQLDTRSFPAMKDQMLQAEELLNHGGRRQFSFAGHGGKFRKRPKHQPRCGRAMTRRSRGCCLLI